MTDEIYPYDRNALAMADPFEDNILVLDAHRDAPTTKDSTAQNQTSRTNGDATNGDTTERSTGVKKRNKPTLNCLECVDRKSRCDRSRPSCFACIRRQTKCQYTHIADVIAATPSSNSTRKRRRATLPDELVDFNANNAGADEDNATTCDISAPINPLDSLAVQPVFGTFGFDRMPRMTPFFADNGIDTFAPMTLPSPKTSRPSERHALLNLFGAASAEHPFQNYWTDTGGLVEVVASLPSKSEADILIQRFFDTVDPIYPILSRDAFMADVEQFFALPDQAKHRHDPAQIALQFAVYANAAHEGSLLSDAELESDTATFYVSCCHQSLCISSYLNRCSLLTVQTMILICHFLITCNRIADAWSMSGIVQRQVYGLKLNRNAYDLGLTIDDDAIQVRLRLWQATMFQDTLLSLSLTRPPSTTHYDVSHHDLFPLHSAPIPFESSDVAYVRSMWRCSALVQETICSPRSSQQPLALDSAYKSQLIARFRELYSQLEEPFCQTAPTRFDNLPPRLLYQMVTVSSNYFYALMLLYADKNENTGVHSDPVGAINAAHEGMLAFFALVRLLPGHMRVWAAAHNRTYAMAAMIGTMLTLHAKNHHHPGRRNIADDPQLMLGKSDFDRYVNMLSRAQGSMAFRVLQRERLANLQVLQTALRDALL